MRLCYEIACESGDSELWSAKLFEYIWSERHFFLHTDDTDRVTRSVQLEAKIVPRVALAILHTRVVCELQQLVHMPA